MPADELGFRLEDLLQDLKETNVATSELRLLHSLFWNRTPTSGRVELLRTSIEECRSALQHLAGPRSKYDAVGVADLVWLRKISEHLALLVRFAADRDDRDFWLWIALQMHVRGRRLLRSLTQTIASPSAREVRWAIDRYLPAADIAAQVTSRYPSDDHRPWFVGRSAWDRMRLGEEQAVSAWQPPAWRDVINGAKKAAHPGELAILGHYELAYGVYSFRIHATPPGDDPSELVDAGLLAFGVALAAHRVASILGKHEVLAQQVAGTYASEMRDRIRLGPPPAPGDRVTFGMEDSADEHMVVLEVASDGLVARVRHVVDGSTSIRPCLELHNV